MSLSYDSGWKLLGETPYRFRCLGDKADPDKPLFESDGSPISAEEAARAFNLVHLSEIQFSRVDHSDISPEEGEAIVKEIVGRSFGLLGMRRLSGRATMQDGVLRVIIKKLDQGRRAKKR